MARRQPQAPDDPAEDGGSEAELLPFPSPDGNKRAGRPPGGSSGGRADHPANTTGRARRRTLAPGAADAGASGDAEASDAGTPPGEGPQRSDAAKALRAGRVAAARKHVNEGRPRSTRRPPPARLHDEDDGRAEERSYPAAGAGPALFEIDDPNPRKDDVDVWGRSEHFRALTRKLGGFYYRRWFRVEWEGLEKIPTAGGALLIANHAGAIPSDAPMIMHGIEEELGRPVYGLADYFFRKVPVVGTLWSRGGGVAAHPDNAQRLLHDDGQLALVFPEGVKGPSKLSRDRYELRRFGRGGFVETAMRAGVPIVPIAVVGAEESMPVMFKLPAVSRHVGAPVPPRHRQPPAARAGARHGHVAAGEVPLQGARPRALRRAGRARPLPPQPGDGGGGAHPPAAPGRALRDARGPSLGVVRLGGDEMGRRILITGLDTFWGGKMAAALEQHPDVEMLLGMGTGMPSVQLERTEYVRADQSYSLLERIVRATEVDTVVHTFLIVDSTKMSGRDLHEVNVIGTMNLLAAAGAPGSSVRQVVVKSSAAIYGAGPQDPTWFTEDTPRSRPPRTRLERSLTEVESYVKDFADDNPEIAVALLRFANVLGTSIETPISRNLSRGIFPSVAGFDPQVQFVEEDDVVRCFELVVRNQVRGVYNVAGDDRLPWSEVARIASAWRIPLPPLFTRELAAPLIRAHMLDLPPELEDLLRFGRGLDTTRMKSIGFECKATSAGAVESFARAMRLKRTVGHNLPRYQYDSEVEAFFKHSPAVVRNQPTERV